MAKLIVKKGMREGTVIDVGTDAFVLGRDEHCDLPLKDNAASGHHCRLNRAGRQWTLEDLKSTNGTLLNNEEVEKSILHEGDTITVGGHEFLFSEEPSGPAVSASHSASAHAEVQATAEDVMLVEAMSRNMALIRQEVAKVIVGQTDVLNDILMSMISGGHALLVGMPGMAKTLMVSTVARVLDLQFKRIQFTPDLMPSDITGTEILETNKETMEKEFRFVRGPIFCNVLLADEINRTPPKTQAALLEAMQEKRVTVGNETYTLDAPFFVLATQNPIEQEGTYPLPEAQMDRFMFNIWVDYPLEHEEEQIARSTTTGRVAAPSTVLSKEQILQLQQVTRKIPVSDHVIKYAIRLVRGTRPSNPGAPDFIKKYVSTGAGPRAGQYLILAAKARAVLEGRIHVSCADIRRAAIPVLRHRILTTFAADSEGLTSIDLVKKLLESIREPSEEDYAGV